MNGMKLTKDLIAASAMPLILSLLEEGEGYGYAIIRRVRELSGGGITWTDGMLYPLLHRLERHGHVRATWGVAESGRKRKHYAITPAGREALAERHRQWEVVAEALDNVWRAATPPETGWAH